MPEINRSCVVCGDRIQIKVGANGRYDNGHFFGVIKVPIKRTGKYRRVGSSKVLGRAVPVVKWTGKERDLEYWECDLCYDAAARESWFEKRIEKYYGQRCPDSEPSCACCDAWARYDKIVKRNLLRGNFRQEYDRKADATYIYIKDSIRPGAAVETLELDEHINLDFDKNKNLIGIEVLNASRHTPKVFGR